MRLRAKVDRNQGEIVAALRKAGVYTYSLAQTGKGCPDLVCSYGTRTVLLEVKMPKEHLTPDQVRWHRAWNPQAPVYVVETIDDALLVTREHRDSAGRYRG